MTTDLPTPILIYGNSPTLTATERVLRRQSGMQVIHIDPTHPTAMQQLSALGDGVLIYDCRTIDSELIKAIHMLYPHITTVGLGEGQEGRDLTLLGRVIPRTDMKNLLQVLALVGETDAGPE